MERIVRILAVLLLAAGTAFATGGKEASSSEATSMVVWDTFSTDDSSKLIDGFISDYHVAHPNVKIERRVTAAEDMRKTIKLSLGSGTGPDVFYYDAGPAFGEVLVRAGLVEYLDQAYTDRGWDKRIGRGPRDMVTFNGKTYAIPNEVEFHTMWYNADIFHKLSLSPPGSWSDFVAICQKLTDNGLIAWPYADRKGIWYTWVQAPFFEAVAGGPQVLKALRGETPWNSPDFVQAVAIEKEFYQKKYFNPHFAALDSPELRILFYTQKAGMMPRGSWEQENNATGKKDGTIAFNYDLFDLPPYRPGVAATSPGGIGSAWFVSAASTKKAAALDFLDATISDKAALGWLKTGLVPALSLTEDLIGKAGLDPIMTKIVKRAPGIHNAATNVFLPGNVNEYLRNNAPRAWKGEISPQELQDNFQKLFQEYLGSIK